MKKAILILCACLLLAGCGSATESSGTTESSGENKETEYTNMFVIVESNWYYKIVYHKDTKVMYAVSRGNNNQGTFTLLVNADGTPMLYEGEVEE